MDRKLFRFDIVKASFIPPADIRGLRELSRYRLKLSYMRTAEKNRYQNSMTISRIRTDCVLTDPFGVSVTGIAELSALFILSEIGAVMSVFESDRHLCSWAGLTPANNESANKKKSTRCSRAGQFLKSCS